LKSTYHLLILRRSPAVRREPTGRNKQTMTTCLRYVRGRAVTSKGIEGDKYLNRNGQIAVPPPTIYNIS